MSLNLSDIAVLNLKTSDYCRIISLIGKNVAIKTPIFLKDVGIDRVLVSNKISFGKENCKWFIGFLYNDCNLKPLHT